MKPPPEDSNQVEQSVAPQDTRTGPHTDEQVQAHRYNARPQPTMEQHQEDPRNEYCEEIVGVARARIGPLCSSGCGFSINPRTHPFCCQRCSISHMRPRQHSMERIAWQYETIGVSDKCRVPGCHRSRTCQLRSPAGR